MGLESAGCRKACGALSVSLYKKEAWDKLDYSARFRSGQDYYHEYYLYIIDFSNF